MRTLRRISRSVMKPTRREALRVQEGEGGGGGHKEVQEERRGWLLLLLRLLSFFPSLFLPRTLHTLLPTPYSLHHTPYSRNPLNPQPFTLSPFNLNPLP
jgi:hypothetical protein